MELSVFYDHIADASLQTGKNITDILKQCGEMGISGLEINFSLLNENKNTICRELSDSGMKISCIYETFDFGRDKDTSVGRQMIDTAVELKAPRILVIPGELESWEAAELSVCSGSYELVDAYMNNSQSIQNMQRALSELVEYATPRKIQVTLEDFDGFRQPFARINQLLWFMRHVEGLKYTFDMGNFAFSDENPAKATEVLKDYIVHVHCKDRKENHYVKGKFNRGLESCPTGEGYIPIDSLVKALIKDGYDGYLAIEHFGLQNQMPAMEKSAEFLRKYLTSVK